MRKKHKKEENKKDFWIKSHDQTVFNPDIDLDYLKDALAHSNSRDGISILGALYKQMQVEAKEKNISAQMIINEPIYISLMPNKVKVLFDFTEENIGKGIYFLNVEEAVNA